jgi:thioredoxin-like negative regulator of GroEL
VHLRAAAILWRQGQRAAAIERWKQALELLAVQASRGAVETAPLVAVLDSIGSRKLLPELREPADRMLRAYVARNGTYRPDGLNGPSGGNGFNLLLRAAFRAAGDAAAGTDWLIEIGRSAPDPIRALGAIANASWLPDLQRDRVFERIVALAEESAAQEHGAAQAEAQGEAERWHMQRIRSLIDTKQAARADELLRAVPLEERRRHDAEMTTLEARIAAANRTLDGLLDAFARDENRPVNLGALRNAATALRRGGDAASARRILEFVYERQLDGGMLTPPVFLGLAEIRLEQGNVPAALALLTRLSLVVGEPFENLPASGALLERTKHPAEALEYRRNRVKAVPWDANAQIALARAEIAAGGDTADALGRLGQVRDSRTERYAVRVEAARAFASAGGRLGRPPRSELDWLSAPAELTPAAADQPMFVAARVSAARRATDPPARVNLLAAAVAIDPGDRNLRVPLFRADMAAGRAADALEAVQPILSRSRSLTGVGLAAADRVRLARELGEACQQVDRLPDAVRFLTIALEGESAAGRAPIRQRISRINEEIDRRAKNATRQPRVSQALDQPRLVRPRIAPKPAAGGAR